MPSKSKSVAFLLAFFFGPLGAHRFYINKTGSAVAMLILSLTGIGMLITGPWALIDCIIILTGSLKDGNGNRLQ